MFPAETSLHSITKYYYSVLYLSTCSEVFNTKYKKWGINEEYIHKQEQTRKIGISIKINQLSSDSQAQVSAVPPLFKPLRVHGTWYLSNQVKKLIYPLN